MWIIRSASFYTYTPFASPFFQCHKHTTWCCAAETMKRTNNDDTKRWTNQFQSISMRKHRQPSDLILDEIFWARVFRKFTLSNVVTGWATASLRNNNRADRISNGRSKAKRKLVFYSGLHWNLWLVALTTTNEETISRVLLFFLSVRNKKSAHENRIVNTEDLQQTRTN